MSLRAYILLAIACLNLGFGESALGLEQVAVSKTIASAATSANQTAAESPRPAESSSDLANQWIWWVALGLPLAVLGGIFYGAKVVAPANSAKSSEPKAAVAKPPQIETAPEPAMEPPADPAIAPPPGSLASLGSPIVPTANSLMTTPTETTRLTRVDIVEELVNDLHSLEPNKRRQAIWELGQRGDSRAIQPLVNLLMDADSQQRSLILAALSEIGTRTLKPMQRALMMSMQDDSPEVRKNAIRDMTRLCDVVVQISQIVQYAASDTDAEVRDTAQWALSQLDRIRSLSEREE
ncbi:HEAT repeat domain-containing protein [Phormidium tenue FACHB-886]|nr:HEAT repeat domain-containing protein [Phormidium tenue FACHB-886]